MASSIAVPESADAVPTLPETCSRCESTLDTDGCPHWCKACRAKYQREYQALRKQMAEGRGFSRGVEAFRAMLVEEFDRLGAGSFTGSECAALIAGARLPPA